MKKNNKKGFTLAELLIVVAIIGILVAISIPVFTSQLKKAKDATNAANARSLYAQLTADYLDDGKVNEAPKKDGSEISDEIDLSSSDADITIGTEKYHFTKLDGAKIHIENASSTATTQPKVTYTHGNNLNFDPQAQTWGAASASSETPGSGD